MEEVGAEEGVVEGKKHHSSAGEEEVVVEAQEHQLSI